MTCDHDWCRHPTVAFRLVCAKCGARHYQLFGIMARNVSLETWARLGGDAE